MFHVKHPIEGSNQFVVDLLITLRQEKFSPLGWLRFLKRSCGYRIPVDSRSARTDCGECRGGTRVKFHLFFRYMAAIARKEFVPIFLVQLDIELFSSGLNTFPGFVALLV